MVNRIHFVFLGIGHFCDHLFMLLFATVAALSLSHQWGMSYAELIPYATPGFVAFGVFTLPAGWLADKWSRNGMMVTFYIGIGLSSIFTAFANTPLQIGIGLFAIGIFAAIYHPVGLALVVQGRDNTGVPLAINGVFGNMGVASAALIAGFFIGHAGWRSAFVWPGILSIAIGIAYAIFLYAGRSGRADEAPRRVTPKKDADTIGLNRRLISRVLVIIILSTAIGGLVFRMVRLHGVRHCRFCPARRWVFGGPLFHSFGIFSRRHAPGYFLRIDAGTQRLAGAYRFHGLHARRLRSDPH